MIGMKKEILDTLIIDLQSNTPTHPFMTQGSLNLTHQDIDDDQVALIANALQANRAVHEIILKKNKIYSRGAEAIAKLIATNHNLTSIDLSDNTLGMRGITFIAQALPDTPSLTKLVLRNVGGNALATRRLAAGIQQSTSLRIVDFEENEAGLLGTEAILEALTHSISLLSLQYEKTHMKVNVEVEQLLARNQDASGSSLTQAKLFHEVQRKRTADGLKGTQAPVATQTSVSPTSLLMYSALALQQQGLANSDIPPDIQYKLDQPVNHFPNWK